ncbi:MAG: DnaJ domain-containing protein [Oscillospiraceae bacterium]
MTDPYKTLGVSPSASDDEIKQAYRDLAKKYHPDNYSGSPLSDLAGEKMSEINAAYDAVQSQRKNGGYASRQGYAPQGSYSQGQSSYNSSSSYGQPSGQYADIRRLLSMRRILEAEELLDGIPTSKRDAEWHFLKGSVLYTRGFLEDALNYLQTAVSLDPQNPEYRSTLDAIMHQRQYGYNGGQAYASTCDPCSCCAALACSQCACNGCRCFC